jgi:hypothetical protein
LVSAARGSGGGLLNEEGARRDDARALGPRVLGRAALLGLRPRPRLRDQGPLPRRVDPPPPASPLAVDNSVEIVEDWPGRRARGPVSGDIGPTAEGPAAANRSSRAAQTGLGVRARVAEEAA